MRQLRQRGRERTVSLTATGARLDHLLVAVADLDGAAERFLTQYGLASIGGGSHGTVGTANRLIPLGEQYIELIARVDPASRHPLAELVAAMSAAGDRLFGISVAVDDIDAVAERIGSAVVPMTRANLDGTSVAFRVTGMEGSIGPNRLPFFIEWGDGAENRLGLERPAHRVGVRGLAWVELGGDPDQARHWLGGDVAGVRLVGGEPGVRAAALATDAGEVVVSSP
ncbi:MAG: VOC family protein [Actinobacteria bacterium]|nr:VOC family protein [Actinomycetota bacterium]